MASPLAKQVASCNRRARDRGLAHTLTTLDWQRTLDFFDHKCVCTAVVQRGQLIISSRLLMEVVQHTVIVCHRVPPVMWQRRHLLLGSSRHRLSVESG